MYDQVYKLTRAALVLGAVSLLSQAAALAQTDAGNSVGLPPGVEKVLPPGSDVGLPPGWTVPTQQQAQQSEPVKPNAAASAPTPASVAATSQSPRQQAMEHKFEKAEKYYAECQGIQDGDFDEIKPYLKAFTDVEVMAQTMANPVKAAKLMQIVSDPRTMHVMMKCATEPVMWDTWVSGLSDYNKMTRAMMQFMNPMMYMNWMMAPMNPQMYAPMMQMMDPNYYGKWMTAMMNPMFYQPIFSLADPNWYTPRIQWMMDPQSLQPIVNSFGTIVPSGESQ